MQTDSAAGVETPVAEPSCSKSVRGPQWAANPPTGFGPQTLRFVQRVPLWGALGWRQSGPGLKTRLGYPEEKQGREELNHERPARACR